MIIGFIGTGAIAAAMVRGLGGQGHDLRVSPRNSALAAQLAGEMEEVSIHENAAMAQDCDVVFLCLMAGVAREVLPTLSFRPGIRLISVMVDVDLATLTSFATEAASIDITIPLPQIATGGCPLPCYPGNETVVAVFGPQNPSFAVKDERALNAHFAASALMSTTLDQIATGADWLAGFTGDATAAQFYISHMISSALATIGENASVPQMLEELSTEGGLNATLKAHMRGAGADTALTKGLDAFQERLGL